MKGKRWIAVALVCLAGVGIGGCSIFTGAQGDVREESETMGEDGLVVPSASSQETEESSQTKPTKTEPESIPPFPDAERETKAEPMEDGERIVLMTDVHYLARSLTDRGSSFQNEIEHGDGKLTHYVWEIVDAAFDEIELLTPDVLIVSGDLTLNGEVKSHEEFAALLDEVERRGISVLVIPGNHDINSRWASSYIGKNREPVQTIDAGGFASIYAQFGYNEASERDPYSLSYTYDLSPSMRLLMLDTCQYEPKNMVEGQLKVETFQWADEQLKKAKKDGINVLPIGHHNLLAQSRMYTTQCAMNNNGDVIELFQKYELPLYLSGHLHVQRIRKHKAEPGAADDSYGIMEIVTDALSIPPCQYALLEWKRDGSMEYSTKAVDVSAWAARTGSQNPDLLDFEGWSELYIQKLIIDQIRGVVKNLGNDVEHSMAEVYASVYIDYYAGRRIDAKGIRSSKGYRWWERNMPDSYLLKELDAMIDDSDRDNNYMLLPEVNAAAEE